MQFSPPEIAWNWGSSPYSVSVSKAKSNACCAVGGPVATGGDKAVPSGPPTAQQAFNYALDTDTEYGDDPQFQAVSGGQNCTLAETVYWIPIPILWRYLFPWQILPDPPPDNPEDISELASQVSALVAAGQLSRPLVEVSTASTIGIVEAIRTLLPSQ